MLRHPLARLLAATTVAATLAAAPARAEDDTLRTLAGVAATALVLGAILDHVQDGTVEAHHTGRKHHHYGARKGWHRPALPRHCIRAVGRHKTWHVLGGRCLKRHYPAAHLLPKRCALRAWHKGRHRTVYRIGCLRHSGFVLTRRH
ncbi:hypothetical protein [Pseudoponticoccus marisrubri]|uniref:Uncharacterized protein n=1 Tax=Pseudoponticoccus marisrubri TaxID=1685382 RepID=A0A0W7WIQ3_9RHOB|nr:hypothetical protein [Pseudoponticoccus marisrubri]KUF10492.1 hypothetical protein AVJ23_11450 [Pseudoponticoccus marisrubri]